MKAIVMGFGIGMLALMTLVKLDSKADADCEGCGAGAAFANLANDLYIDGNRDFSDDGDFAWCVPNFEPTGGLAQFVGGSSLYVHGVTVTPTFFNPSGCSNSFAVHVDGTLDNDRTWGLCAIYGWVYQPYTLFDDDHSYNVYE